eukprot:1563732-Prymnesium_polylepis.2
MLTFAHDTKLRAQLRAYLAADLTRRFGAGVMDVADANEGAPPSSKTPAPARTLGRTRALVRRYCAVLRGPSWPLCGRRHRARVAAASLLCRADGHCRPRRRDEHGGVGQLRRVGAGCQLARHDEAGGRDRRLQLARRVRSQLLKPAREADGARLARRSRARAEQSRRQGRISYLRVRVVFR